MDLNLGAGSKKQIPIRTFADWDEVGPGFLEADLVAHGGDSAGGSFLHTLVMTDVTTQWTECFALLFRDQENRTQRGTAGPQPITLSPVRAGYR